MICQTIVSMKNLLFLAILTTFAFRKRGIVLANNKMTAKDEKFINLRIVYIVGNDWAKSTD